jgi:hypothetical protein
LLQLLSCANQSALLSFKIQNWPNIFYKKFG